MIQLAKKHLLITVLIVAGAALVLDRCIAMYFDARQEMVTQRDSKSAALQDARAKLAHHDELRGLLTELGPTVHSDSSQIEGKFLHLMHDWEQQTSVTNASFQRSSAVEEHGYTRLTFQVSAAGNMAAIAGLLYRVETSPIPIRIDDCDVRGKTDGGDLVQMHLTVSTLCHSHSAGASGLAISGPSGGQG